jgi:hypothetical protein
MANVGISNPELEGLRDEISRLRREILDARVERSARHLELMRNWMAVYTPTVTLVILIFGVLGYRGLSDIQSNREKFDATATRAETLLQDVGGKFESVKKEEVNFEGLVAENEKVVQQNRKVLSGFQSSLDELDRKHVELRNTEVQIKGELQTLSRDVQKLSKDVKTTSSSLSASLSSSVAFTSGIGDVLSASLKIPIITSLTGPTADLSMQGLGFGSSRGKVLVNVTKTGAFDSQLMSTLTTGPDSVELPQAAITNWSDTLISCPGLKQFVTETFHEDFDTRQSAILIQVIDESGAKSNVYTLFARPPAPTSLNVTVP